MLYFNLEGRFVVYLICHDIIQPKYDIYKKGVWATKKTLQIKLNFILNLND